MWLRPIAHASSLFAELRIVSQNRIRGSVCERVFCFSDPAKEDTSEVPRDFVGQTKVRALLHHIQGIAEFSCKCGIWAIVHLVLIVSDDLRGIRRQIPVDRPAQPSAQSSPASRQSKARL